MNSKTKRGRPRSAYTEQVWVRCTKKELKEWKQAAEADGRTLSGWIRYHLAAAYGEQKMTPKMGECKS